MNINQPKFSFFRIQLMPVMALLCCQLGFSQSTSYDVEHFSTKQGLSDHRVYTVSEHSSGYLFIGTQDGVNWFDGYSFYQLTRPAIPEVMNNPYGNCIMDLTEIEQGLVLVTYGSTITSIKRGYYAYDPLTRESRLASLLDIDSDTPTYLVGSDTLKTVKTNWNFAPKTDQWQDHFGNRVVFNRIDSEMIIHLSTGQLIDISSEWKKLSRGSRPFSKNFSESLYFGSHNGLLKISINSLPFKTYLSASIKDWEYRFSGRSSGQIDQNRILFSTEIRPISIYNQRSSTSQTLIVTDENTGKVVRTTSLRGIHFRNDSIVWLSPQHGPFQRLNLNTNQSQTFNSLNPTHIYTSIDLKNNHILMAAQLGEAGTGLIEFDPHSQKVTRFELEEAIDQKLLNTPNYLLESTNGNIWLATMNGLFQFDAKTKKIVGLYIHERPPKVSDLRFPIYPILADPNVLVMSEDSNGHILLGTEKQGIFILNPITNDIENFTTEDGLPGNTVCGILPDQNGYWLSTYSGLCFFDTSNKTFRNFYKEDGLPHNEFNRFSFFQNSDGNNFFGTMNGFVSFDPEEILNLDRDLSLQLSEYSHYSTDGKTQITNARVFSKPPSIIIPSMYRSCSFKMSINDLSNDVTNTYSYYLEPQSRFTKSENPIWRQNGSNREIKFEYLPAGQYRLRIKGATQKGSIKKEFVIPLHIREVFYKTWWFVTSILFLGLGLGYLFYRNRLNNAIKMERLRTRLSSDLHDDVGSVLSGVAYQMELLEYTVEEKHKSLVQQIAASSRSAMSQMRDVVWAIDTRKSTIQDLTERMKEFAEEVLQPLDINYQFNFENVHLDKTLSSEVRHNLLLIFKEFVTNTVKHANASKVNITLKQVDSNHVMIINDNGRGLQSGASSGTGQGLNNMKMRAEKVNGFLAFQNGQGFGIEVKVPI